LKSFTQSWKTKGTGGGEKENEREPGFGKSLSKTRGQKGGKEKDQKKDRKRNLRKKKDKSLTPGKAVPGGKEKSTRKRGGERATWKKRKSGTDLEHEAQNGLVCHEDGMGYQNCEVWKTSQLETSLKKKKKSVFQLPS